MTPKNAAPEQFKRGTITTSVDAYSLGIILYELLAGVRPFDLSDKSIAEIERLVCDKKPDKPSQKNESDSYTAAASLEENPSYIVSIICKFLEIGSYS